MTIDPAQERSIPDNFLTNEFKRYEAPNPLNLSKLDLIQKRREVEDLQNLYPGLPHHLLCDLWEYHHIIPKDDLLEKINSGYFEAKQAKQSKP